MADELSSRLGFDVSQAIGSLNSLTRTLETYNAGLLNTATASAKFNTSGQATDAVLKVIAASANAAAAELRNLASAQKAVSTTTLTPDDKFAKTRVAAERQKADELRKIQEQQLRGLSGRQPQPTAQIRADASKDVPQITRLFGEITLSWQSVIRILTLRFTATAVQGIITALVEAGKAAKDFEIRLAEVTTIGEGFFSTIDETEKKVIELSNAFGAPVEDVTAGLYQALSNQVGTAAQTFEFLQVSSELAAVGVTSTREAVDTLSSVLNTFQLPAERAEAIAAKLFRTVDLGRVRMEELSNTIGRVLPLAQEMGVSFDEVAASIVVMTQQGIKANEAYTLISNVLLKLAKPSEVLTKELQKLGIASGEAGIQAFGFAGFLDVIARSSGDSASELGKTFTQIRAIRGALGLTGSNLVDFNEALAKIQETDLTQFREAVDKIFGTNAKQIDRDLQQLRNTFIELERGALGAFDAILKGINFIIPDAKTLGAELLIIGGLVTAFGVKSVLSLAGVSSAVKFLTTQLRALQSATIFGAGLAAGFAIGSAIIDNIENTGKAISDAVKESSKVQLEAAKRDAEAFITTNTQKNNAIFSANQQLLQGILRLQNQEKDAITREQTVITEIIKGQLKSRLDAAQNVTKALRDVEKEAVDQIKDSQTDITDAQREIADNRFESRVSGLDPVSRAFQQQQRAADLARKAADELAKTQTSKEQIQSGLADFDRAKALAEAAKQSAIESGNTAAIFRAEQSIEDILNRRIAAQEKLIQLKQQEATDAANAAQASEVFLSQVKAETELADKALEEFSKNKFDPGARDSALGDFNAAVSRLSQLQIPDLVKDFAQRADLKKIVLDAENALRGIRPQDIDISNALTISSVNITSQLSAAFDALPENLKVLAIDLEINPEEAITKLQQRLIDAKKQIEQDLNKAALFGPQIAAANTSIQQIAGLISEIASSTGAGADTQIPQLTQVLNLINTLIQRRDQAGNIQLITPDEVAQVQGLLTQITDTPGLNVVNAETAAVIREISTVVGNLARETVAVQNAAVNQQNLVNFQNTFATAKTTSDEIKSTLEGISLQNQQSTLINSALEFKRIIETTQPPRAQAAGGTIFRAAGGRGTDTIPAMLSPGEFVVNARSTRRFFSQLQAINSGKMPIYRAQGGEVTNIGDININLSQQQTRVGGREIAAELRRELRRRTIKLRG